MTGIDGILQGLVSLASVSGLLLIVGGVALGVFVGALPGLGPTVGMAATLPLVIRLPPEQSIWFLMALVIGASYGNSITAIVLGIPGSPAAILTTMESEAFRRDGTELRAVTTALMSSTIGQTVAVVLFIFFIIPLSRISVRFLFPELFALTLFSLITIISLDRSDALRSAIAASLGFALGLIGPDPITSQIRFGFGVRELSTGLPVVPALIGMLAFREVFRAAGTHGLDDVEGIPLQFKWPSLADLTDIRKQTAGTSVGTGVGAIVGALPGAGASVATFVTYGVLQMNRRLRRELGQGSLQGIAAVDAAQNSASTTALVPTLALGIPGSAPMVIVMALLSARGLFPGPHLLNTQPQLLNAVFAGLLIACPVLLIVGYFSIGPSVYLSKLSHAGVVSGSIMVMLVGVYSIRWSLIDVWIALIIGIVAYLLNEAKYPIAPAALAMILAPIVETSLRRGLIMTRGPMGFLERPIVIVLIILTGAVVLLGTRMGNHSARSGTSATTPASD